MTLPNVYLKKNTGTLPGTDLDILIGNEEAAERVPAAVVLCCRGEARIRLIPNNAFVTTEHYFEYEPQY